MPTSARYNLGSAICFGTGDAISAEFALSEGTLDAGADPHRWKDKRPGMCYLEATGVDESQWVMPLRHYLTQPEHVKAVVAEYAQPELDEVTAAAAGPAYREYVDMVKKGTAPWQTPGVVANAPIIVDSSSTDDDDFGDSEIDEAANDLFDDDLDEPLEIPPPPEDKELDEMRIDNSLPLEEDPDEQAIQLAPPMPSSKVTPEDARRELDQFVAKLRQSGQKTLRPSHLIEVRLKVGRSPAWLSEQMLRLMDEGVIESLPVKGQYRLRPVSAAA